MPVKPGAIPTITIPHVSPYNTAIHCSPFQTTPVASDTRHPFFHPSCHPCLLCLPAVLPATPTADAALLDTVLWGTVDSLVELDRGAMLAMANHVTAMHIKD